MKKRCIPLTRPTLPKATSLTKKIAEIFKSGMITEYKYVRLFEQKCAQFLGTRYAVATSNGTSALMLTLKCMDLKGEVIVPSFTYSSDAHALLWCGLTPVFADIDPETFNIDPDEIEKKITPKTSAILPTHVFGNPCDISAIDTIARKHNLKIIYDAAHAFGSLYEGKPVGAFGDASIYSLTPTKVLTAGEGGLVLTNDVNLVNKLKIAKLNGDSLNREEEFLGLTARMSELQAIVGLETLKIFQKMIKRRYKVVRRYKKNLASIEGIGWQKICEKDITVYKDLVITIDEKKTGFSRDDLLDALKKNNIQSKVYFSPPLHLKKVYSQYKHLSLPQTNYLSNHIMNLPIYSHMPFSEVDAVCNVIIDLYKKL
ncbi:DegT/DnrJ/EryC1/StrS family aminotransferase [Candidatus Peregrinibacteria bacterium]|nr:DegT/DnrJ/EryC1/StrS family aminotransferase [Candidatus Peregrinibacteria bacterium]